MNSFKEKFKIAKILASLFTHSSTPEDAIVCHFLKIEFQDIHLLYAVLVGCIAYLPKFIADKKRKK